MDIYGLDAGPTAAILRRDWAFEIMATSVANEFEFLKILRAEGFPVPRALAAQRDGAMPLCRPVLIMEKLPGTALEKINPGTLAKVDSQSATPEAILQMAGPLARLHALDVTSLPVPNPPTSSSRRQSFMATLDEYRDRLHRIQRAHYPAVEAGFGWLYNNASLIDDKAGLVHGDYDLRNMLYEDGKLTAILTLSLPMWGTRLKTLAICAKTSQHLCHGRIFWPAYQAAGGPQMSDALIHYFEVWAYVFFFVCTVCSFSAYRNGEHNDVFLGTAAFVEFEHVTNRLLGLLKPDQVFFIERDARIHAPVANLGQPVRITD